MQGAFGVVEARFDGAFGDVQDRGDLEEGEIVEEKEGEEFSLWEGELGEGVVDGLGIVEIGFRFGVFGEGGFEGFGGFGDTEAAEVDGFVAGDAIEPRGELGDVVEFVDVAEGAEPDMLEDVPGVGFLGDEAGEVIEEARLPGGDEVGQAWGSPRVAAQGEELVTKVVGGRSHDGDIVGAGAGVQMEGNFFLGRGLEVGEFEFPVGAVGEEGFAADDVFVGDFVDDDGFREDVDDEFAGAEGDDAGAGVAVPGEFIGAAVHGEERAQLHCDGIELRMNEHEERGARCVDVCRCRLC